MVAQPPKLETTLARDELAFVTTHPSLKRCLPAIPSFPPNAATEEPCAVLLTRVLTRGLSSTCIKPDAGCRRGVAARAKSRQSITTSVYILQGVVRQGPKVVPRSPG